MNVEQLVASALIMGARIGGLMSFAPFFGSAAIPVRVKVALTVVTVALLYPVYRPVIPAPTLATWLQMVSGELLLGLMLGFVLQIVFEGAVLAGQVLGFQLGYSLVNLIDPQTEVETPVMSIFHQTVALLIFLQLDVHHWIVRGIAKSFQYVPPGHVAAKVGGLLEMLRASGAIWTVALQIAAPALAATFLTDLALGYAAKASPQLPVLFLGISVKGVVGLAVLWAALSFWPSLMERYFTRALLSMEHLLRLAS